MSWIAIPPVASTLMKSSMGNLIMIDNAEVRTAAKMMIFISKLLSLLQQSNNHLILVTSVQILGIKKIIYSTLDEKFE